MIVDYLIVGQGICGTMLSWFLHKAGKSFVVIEDGKQPCASRMAAGVINPVTGRRYAYTWMIDELIDFSILTYNELGRLFDETIIYEKSIIDFFPSAQMRNSFIDRLTDNDTYLHSYPEQNDFNESFNYEFGCGEIKPTYLVRIQRVIEQWHHKLQEKQAILSELFEASNLQILKDSIIYKDIKADKIIFCDGIGSVNNPWFHLLPFAPNKGEAILIECHELFTDHVFKKGLMLVPVEENIYWLGSNYLWEFENDQPSEQFYKSATQHLNHWLKKPFKILAHNAAVRPATIERRPFLGFHPVFPNIGILNGMGTKGVSLAPYFAHQMVQFLTDHLPLSPEADIHRFQRILSRS
jgi:FAD dependent oxidoreductase.